MSIRVQCGGCGSVMNVRDEYAGTERRCPKCKGKFHVPAAGAATAGGSGGGKSIIAGDDFDPVAYLTGETPLPGTIPAVSGQKPTAARSAADDFDPMDVLAGGAAPPAKTSKSSTSTPKLPASAKAPAAAPPAAPKPAEPPPAEFDPLDVLGSGPAPAATASPPPAAAGPPAAAPPTPPPPATPGQPAKPQPRRPSWAKAAPEPEKNDWDDPPPATTPAAAAPASPPTQPEKPQPRRPSWAKAAPAPEKNDWDDPPPAGAAPAAVSTATPASAQAAATSATSVAADASAAAKAAAAAMDATIAAVSADNPLLQAEQPRQPWIDPAAIVAAFRRRIPLITKTAVAALLLFAGSWWFIRPGRVVWSPVGSSQKLQLVPVAGRITVDGKPVADARVMFHPRGPQFRSPEGHTDGDGQFRLSFCEGYTGAPPGRYRVQLQLIGKDGSDSGAQAELLLRDRSFEVPPAGGIIDVALNTKSKPSQ